jgi:hypothetical protein
LVLFFLVDAFARPSNVIAIGEATKQSSLRRGLTMVRACHA